MMKRPYNKLFSTPKGGSPFRPGSDFDVLFQESRRRGLNPDALVEVVARKLQKSPQVVKYKVYELTNPRSSSNRHKCSLDKALLESQGVLRFVAT